MFVAETFVELVKDPNHWLFEIMLMVLFDGLVGALAWPYVKQAVRKHDERKHAHECVGEIMMDEEEKEFSPFLDEAIRLNELYRGMVEGGFSKQEALQIIIGVLAGGAKPQ